MRTSALSTKKNNAVLKKSAWKVMKNNGYLLIVVVAVGLSFGNNEWAEALSILGNNGAYNGGIPSFGDLGQMVDRVEDELIGHDVSEVPDSLVSRKKLEYILTKLIIVLTAIKNISNISFVG